MNPFRDPDGNDPVCRAQVSAWSEERSATSAEGRRDVSARGRILAAATTVVLLVPLVIACLLEPDPRGHGTHQQLGLPPCTLVALCGLRCPTCGMTTSWSAVVHGQLLVGLAANVGGVLLALAAIGSIVGLWATAICGRRPRWFPTFDGIARVGMAIAAVTLLDWIIRILLS